jgi:hypothetical protein
MAYPPERRKATKFTEKLSLFMVVTAALGGFLVLIDPRGAWTMFGHPFSFGGDGFSAELKGAVVTIMLIGGWTAVKEFWLGSSAGSQNTAETIGRIAEQSAPVAAAAVAAAAGAPNDIKASDVTVEATGDVTIESDKK